jgi:hypothetical protein
VLSNSGFQFYLAILDDFTHYVWVYPWRHKSEVPSFIQSFCAYVQNQFSRSVSCFQSDNGREFDNSSLHSFFSLHAFSFDSPAHIPRSKMARLNAFFSHSTIAFALFFCTPRCHIASGLRQLTAAYLLNRHPCKPAALASPFELLYGIAPSYQHLGVFGCLCFPNTTATALHKLAPRSSKCVFLGYPTDHKGYRCYDLSTR